MKKKLFVIAIAMLLLAGVTAGTVAYFTTKTVAHNVITTGEIDIELVEKQDLDGNPATPETDYPENPVDGIMPGKDHSKIVRIENVGPNPAWVRIKVEVSVKDQAGKELGADKLRINYHTLDTDKWLEKNGVYYYKEKLDPGDRTTPLFDTVAFSETMGNDHQNATISINVQAEGIQYQNNTNFDTAWPADIEILKNIF